MRKESWPYIIGDPELEMGARSFGDHRDINMESNPRYDSLVAGKYTTPESEVPVGYSGGVFFPVDEEIEEDEYKELEELSKEFLHLLEKESTVLGVGRQTDNAASIILKDGHNLINLSKNADSKVNIHDFHQEYGNPMFHSFRKRFDGFYITGAETENDSFEIVLENISNYLRPTSCGLIVTSNSSDVSNIIEKMGFDIITKHINKLGKYLVSKNDLDKIAVIRYHNNKKDEDTSVVFKCDIAKTSMEKINGLQVYPRLNKRSGLLFPYNKPSDVSYHMGSVNYPIDIIFIDEDSRIKKICRNIQPGSLEIYSCAGVKNVLEISGGLSDLLGIKESRMIYIEPGADIDKSLSKAAGIIEDFNKNNYIFKKSNILSSGTYNVLGNKIYIVNNNENQDSITQLVKTAMLGSEPSKNIIAFDIDDLFLNDEFKIKLYRRKVAEKEDRIFRGLYNETFSIHKTSFIELKLSDIVSSGFYKNINSKYSIIPNQNLHFQSQNNKERNDVLNKIALNSKKSIVFVSRKNIDRLLLESILEKEFEVKTGAKLSLSSELVRVPENFGSKDIFFALKEKYSETNIELYGNSLIKSAGIPVTDDVKGKARHALRYFNRSKDMCDTLVQNFGKNLAAYQKVQENKQEIANSKGKYSQSSKRNSRIAKRMLINIKNGIKILNEIKDISTTSEIISAIADSAKNASESIKEVFELINFLDSDDFVNQCAEKTQNVENTVNDLKLTLSRTTDYINSDILGVLILSE